MHDTTLALTILALFTSRETAEEIEGDLLEQSRSKGRMWFWWQVKLTCVALFFHGLREDAGKVLMFAYATYELVLKLNWWVMLPTSNALRRGLYLSASHASVHDVMSTVWAFGLGMLLTRLSPKHGGQLVVLVAGLMLGRVMLLDGIPEALRLTGFGLLPAVLGAVLMKWLELRHDRGVHASH